MTSAGWQQLITARRWLRSYSLNNVLLILAQRPGATDVRSFRAWQEVGRHVCQGERALRIWAPSTRRRPDPDTPEDAQDESAIVTRFVLVPVFDVAQTDGAPLPAPASATPERLTGDAPAWLWQATVAVISDDGFTVERGDCHGAYGHTDFLRHTVRVRADVAAAQATKTLVHELAHIRLDHDTRSLSRPTAEVEAESVACIVSACAGLDTLPYSVPYVAGWASTPQAAQDSAGRVLTVADAVTTALGL
ncbi:ArdC-like ssDNA-binding domain-containing protein [Streptomyces paromomycinus]|nr:ArdC family protein [Streptomyces paromomycinus]